MNNYMERMVAVEKKNTVNFEVNKKTEMKDNQPLSETSLPLRTTSPIASRSKSYRRRSSRQDDSSSEKTKEATQTSPTTEGPKEYCHNESNKCETSNRPSPQRIRQHVRSANSNGKSRNFVSSKSESSSSGQEILSKETNIDNSGNGAPSKDSWMALVKDTDSEQNHSESIDDEDVGIELFQDPAVTFQALSSGPLTPWDEGHHQYNPMMSYKIQNILLEKENVKQELAEIQRDRDSLRQQLSEARTELETARTSLRENILDLEEQLRNAHQSERRQIELKENALLEEEIGVLARLAREHEEKNSLETSIRRNITAINSDVKSSKGGAQFQNRNNRIEPSMNIVSSKNNTKKTEVKTDASAILSQEELLYNDTVTKLEYELKKQRLREQILEEEVSYLKEHAKAESKKLELAQLQVQWFQQELQVMFPKEGEPPSISSNLSRVNTTGGDLNIKNNLSGNIEIDADDLETIMESTSGEKEDDEQMSEKSVDEVCDRSSDASEEGIFADDWSQNPTSFDNKHLGICVIGEKNNLSSSHLNYVPPDNFIHDSRKHEFLDQTESLSVERNPGSNNTTERTPFPSNQSVSAKNSTNNFNHVKLLHEQRFELANRVQGLLDEVEKLRQEQRTYQHEKQQDDNEIQQLQTNSQQRKEQHRVELLLVERQLREWKDRSDSFQMNLEEERSLIEQRDTRSRLEMLERQDLSQQVENLEMEKNELKEMLEKRSFAFEHEKGYLKRAIKSLENKLKEALVDSYANVSNGKKGHFVTLEDITAIEEPLVSCDGFLRNGDPRKELLDRIHVLEADQKSRIESERATREKLKAMTELEKESRNNALTTADRVRVLQAFLDAYFSASPKRERQLELEQEYFSVHPRSRRNDVRERESSGKVSEQFSTTYTSINTDSHKFVEGDEIKSKSMSAVGGAFPDDKENIGQLATFLDKKSFRESRVHKSRDIDEQSTNSDVLVHNLHLKLEEEMGNLKKRKERIRSRAMSIFSTSDKGIGRHFPYLESKSSDSNLEKRLIHCTPQNEAILATKECLPNDGATAADNSTPQTKVLTKRKEFHPQTSSEQKQKSTAPISSDPDEGSAGISTRQTEVVVRTRELQLRDSVMNSEQKRDSHKLNYAETVQADFEMVGVEEEKAQDEHRRTFEDENSRLAAALEIVNNSKTQLEIQLEDAMQQVNDSLDQADTLSSEIMECRCSLEFLEKEKSELLEQLKVERNDSAFLKSKILKNEVEREELDATISKLKDNLSKKDNIILKNNVSHETKIEEMKSEIYFAQYSNSVDQVNRLEQNILLIETKSKEKIEHLSSEVDNMVKERNSLKSNLHSTEEEIDQLKRKESSLKNVIRENHKKFEDAREKFQRHIKSQELDNADLENTISEKNQRIVDLEKDIYSKGRFIEQAAIQLSEMENELFERDDEIAKLDAKRIQIQDSASKQLVDMENSLKNENKDIDRLEQEKSKLQLSLQMYEHQIEKQLGRLTEASCQLSELENEIFAKEDEIEVMALRIGAMQALEVQRLSLLQESETRKKSLEEQLQLAKHDIENLTAQVDKINEEREIEKEELERLLVENKRKNKEILLRQNQLNRQVQNVSKLTEQTDKWQLQLEKAQDEKQELLDSLSNVKKEVASLKEELDISNQKLKELSAINTQLRDDLLCATDEDGKNRLRISQIEEEKETLSQELESALDSLANLQKQTKESRELDKKKSADIMDKLKLKLKSARAVDIETEIVITTLKEEVESERKLLDASEFERSKLENENEDLKTQIRMLVKMNSENGETNATDGLRQESTLDLNTSEIH